MNFQNKLDYEIFFDWFVSNRDMETQSITIKMDSVADHFNTRKSRIYLNKAMIERKCGITFFNEGGRTVFKFAPNLCTDGDRKKQIVRILENEKLLVIGD